MPEHGGVEAGRVAEVIVEVTGGGRRRGSGYRVSTGAVLTAAHVVEDADGVRVRFDADRPGERTVEAAVAWRHPGTDTAVLAVTCPDEVAQAPFGRVGDSDVVLSCSAVGFPRFKLRTGADGVRYRDAEHVHATCAVMSNRKEGTLDLHVTPPAGRAQSHSSPWEGMSGAVVFNAGRIVGVVSRHHLGDGPGRLAASRVDRWAECLPPDRLAELERLLSSALAPGLLPDVVAAPAHGAVDVPFAARLLDIAPDVLQERDAELRLLADFCGGPLPYAWVQAPPWAGKTALAAWFALHPPHSVVPVWFFITGRLAGQADSAAFTEALTHQLAPVAGREAARHTSPAGRDGEWRLLLREAAGRLARDGRTLLLVVDGLDEDRSALTGAPSIAALLPHRPPPNVRVLVTGRPGQGLPADLPGDHPLRRCDPVPLQAVAAARHTEHEASYDLSAVLRGDNLDRDLLGLLAAARSDLTLSDLHELTGSPYHVLRRRLAGFARVLRQRAASPGARPDEHGHLFAHETLLAAALRALGPQTAAYRARIHAWARRYADAGWLPGTPAYLLQPYGRTVAALGETDRALALAIDPRRHDRMRANTHSDSDTLTELDALAAVVAQSNPTPGPTTALAVARVLLAARGAYVPPQIPVARALLGHTDAAVATARALSTPVYRAQALAGIAPVLAARGDPRAADLARQAVDMAEPLDDDLSATVDTPRALVTAATVLMSLGHDADALRALDSREQWASVYPAQALAELAVAAHPRDPARADELLREAVSNARAYTGAARTEALGAVARTCATIDPALSADLYRRIKLSAAATRRHSGDMAKLTAAATALREPDPGRAAQLALAAVDEARYQLRHAGWPKDLTHDGGRAGATGDAFDADDDAHPYDPDGVDDGAREEDGEDTDGFPPLNNPYEAVEGAVAALLAADLPGRAQRVLESWPVARGRKPSFDAEWSDIAMVWARQGRPEPAWRALEESWGSSSYLYGGSHDDAADVTAALAEAGAGAQSEPVVRATAATWPWETAAALATLAGQAAAADPRSAARLLAEAEDLVVPARSQCTQQQLATIAVALAVAGRHGDAEQVAGIVAHPAARAWALAGISLTHAEEGGPHALRLARQAADIVRGFPQDTPPGPKRAAQRPASESADDTWILTDLFVGLHRRDGAGVGAVVQALGCVGAAEEAAQLTARYPARADELRMAAATGLWHYLPAVAVALVRAQEERVKGGAAESDGPVVGRARILLAVGHQDPRRSAWLRRAAVRAAGPASSHSVQDLLVAGLLTAGHDPAAARHRLAAARAVLDLPDREPDPRDSGRLALLYAALGEHPAALRAVRDIDDQEVRAEALTELAAYLAGARGLPMAVRLGGDEGTLPLRRLAALVAPPEPDADGRRTEDGARASGLSARRETAAALLGEVLATDQWHMALPVVAELDPQGFGYVRDVLMTRLGLDEPGADVGDVVLDDGHAGLIR